MASLTNVFGGQPSTGDGSTIPASTLNEAPDDGGANAQAIQEGDGGEAAMVAPDPVGPLGPPTGEPEPFGG